MAGHNITGADILRPLIENGTLPKVLAGLMQKGHLSVIQQLLNTYSSELQIAELPTSSDHPNFDARKQAYDFFQEASEQIDAPERNVFVALTSAGMGMHYKPYTFSAEETRLCATPSA